jgi:hypothetical protein
MRASEVQREKLTGQFFITAIFSLDNEEKYIMNNFLTCILQVCCYSNYINNVIYVRNIFQKQGLLLANDQLSTLPKRSHTMKFNYGKIFN